LAADLLDKMPNKVIGNTYTKIEGTINLDSELPDYFIDAFKYSQEKLAYLLCDDALIVQTYKESEKVSSPEQFSSFSLIRVMAEKKLIPWSDYFNYVARLLGYRYYFVPISVDDLLQAIFLPPQSELVTPTPKNVGLLNLQLSLSQDYGVDEQVAISVLAAFFNKLILDDSLPPERADEIFALTIIQGLAKRDARMVANVIYQICLQNMPIRSWLSQKNREKFDILSRQLLAFAQGIDPVVIDSPVFLRTSHTKDYPTKENPG
jgi:hypothetical protein